MGNEEDINYMERDEAVAYLERKGELDEPYISEERKFDKDEEAKIVKVMKEGKIYGDPFADIQW